MQTVCIQYMYTEQILLCASLNNVDVSTTNWFSNFNCSLYQEQAYNLLKIKQQSKI